MKTFFVQRSPEEIENEYWSLEKQSFILKYYGGLSLFEQDNMTHEIRCKWIEYIKEEIEKENNANKQQYK